MIIAPSVLTVKKEDLKDKLNIFKEAGIKYIHVDIMDGKFVPNSTEGVDLLKRMNTFDFIFDVHLMVENPKDYIKEFVEGGADYITFHYEAVDDPIELIDYIHSFGVKAGISIKPGTDVSCLDNLLDELDLILIMSVEPGFGGQEFMPSALDKINYLDNKRLLNNYKYFIEVDGGVNLDNAASIKDNGCDFIVMGTFICNSNDPAGVVKSVDNL